MIKFSRRIILIGVMLVLLGSLFSVQAASLAEGPQRVFDDAGLLTETEIAMLESEIASARTSMKMDLVVLTSEGAEYSSSDTQAEKNGMAFADDFYDQNGFGVGEDFSGMIYFIDMSNRMPIITTCGKMIDYITDARLEKILDNTWDHLSEGKFSVSVLSVVQNTVSFVKAGIPEGQFQYDTETGQITTPAYKVLTVLEMGIAAGVAAVAGIILYASVHGTYQLKGSTYEYEVRENSDVVITGSQDDFLRTTVTRVPKPRPPTNLGGGTSFGGGRGSGTHMSGGGRTHGGGGGRRF
jgi:uncharacterized protein